MPARLLALLVPILASLVCPAISQQADFEHQELTSPDLGGHYFGDGLRVDGDTALIPDLTIPHYRVRTGRLVGSLWILDGELPLAQGAQSGDSFGLTIALNGNDAIVGSRSFSFPGQPAQGRATVYVRDGDTWTEQASLKASDGGEFDFFGSDVAIDGDRAFVGANGDGPGSASTVGAIYVFQRQGRTWQQVQKLTANDGESGDYFGSALAAEGDTLLVGVQNQAFGPSVYQGCAYVFQRAPNGSWLQAQELVAPDGAAYDWFGYSVALDGDLAAVGSGQAGAYVYRRELHGWSLEQKLVPSQPPFDGFRAMVAVRDDVVLVGYYANSLAVAADYVSIYRHDGASWTETDRLSASDLGSADWFGSWVGFDADQVLVAAIEHDVAVAGDDRGAVYAFDLSKDAWPSLGKALAGGAGPPVLHVMGELAAGAAISLALDQAPPLSSATLVLGFSLLGAPFKGGTLVPQPDVLVPGLPIDANGHLTLASIWPAGVPANLVVAMQAWSPDPAAPLGLVASNAVSVTTP